MKSETKKSLAKLKQSIKNIEKSKNESEVVEKLGFFQLLVGEEIKQLKKTKIWNQTQL